MIKVHNLEVVFDNAGGVTVQSEEFTHHYESPKMAWDDVDQILGGDDTSTWDGNTPDDYVEWSDEQIHSGGYRVFDYEDILDVLDDGEIYSSWKNVCEFFAAAGVKVELDN